MKYFLDEVFGWKNRKKLEFELDPLEKKFFNWVPISLSLKLIGPSQTKALDIGIELGENFLTTCYHVNFSPLLHTSVRSLENNGLYTLKKIFLLFVLLVTCVI